MGGRFGQLLAGVGAIGLAVQALEQYEERELGLLGVGAAAGGLGQYARVRDTLRTLRGERFRIGGREGLAALAPLVRTLGLPPGMEQAATMAMQYGKAYGLSPQEATNLLTQTTLLGRDVTPSLAPIRAVQRAAEAAGVRTLATPAFTESVARTMAVGGNAFLPMTREEAARTNVFMGMFGARQRADPATAFAEYAAGLTGEASTMGEVMRMQMLERQRRRNPYVQVGGRTLNLNDYTDMLIAREQLPLSRELQGRLFEETERQAGGSERALRLNVMEAFSFRTMT